MHALNLYVHNSPETACTGAGIVVWLGHKLVMHALKINRPVRGGIIRTAPHGVHTGPVSERAILV